MGKQSNKQTCLTQIKKSSLCPRTTPSTRRNSALPWHPRPSRLSQASLKKKRTRRIGQFQTHQSLCHQLKAPSSPKSLNTAPTIPSTKRRRKTLLRLGTRNSLPLTTTLSSPSSWPRTTLTLSHFLTWHARLHKKSVVALTSRTISHLRKRRKCARRTPGVRSDKHSDQSTNNLPRCCIPWTPALWKPL